MAATRVQVKTINGTGNGSGVLTLAFDSNVVVGNRIIVAVRGYNEQTGTTCADSLSNSYTTHWDLAGGAGGTVHTLAAFSAEVTTGGACTVTVDMVPVSVPIRIIMCEWSGLTAGAVDKTAADAGGAGTAVDSGATAVLSQADELIIGIMCGDGTGGTLVSAAGSGFTDREYIATRLFMQDKVVAATTAVHALGTLGTTQYWVAGVLAFKVAATALTGSAKFRSGNCKISRPFTKIG